MTYKEKANNIYYIMFTNTGNQTRDHETAKLQSIFTVNSIIDAVKTTTDHLNLSPIEEDEVSKDFEFWKSVRKELQNL